MRYVATAVTVAAIAALAGCDRPTTTSSTTVVKEPVGQAQKDTTIVQAPAQPTPPTTESSTQVTIDASKPAATTEKSSTTTTSRVDTPAGSATRTETETSNTAK